MTVSASDLSEARKRMQGTDPNRLTKPGEQKAGERVEEVVKMFSDDERMQHLSEETVVLKIGRGEAAKSLNLMPLTLGQVLTFLPRLRTALGPMFQMFKERKPGDPAIPIVQIVEAMTENISELPALLAEMFKNGNNVDEEWFKQNLAFTVDMRRIIPAFLYINGFDKMWNLGKAPAPSSNTSNGDDASTKMSVEVTQITDSSKLSPSSVDTTNGQTSTSSES